MPDAGPQIGSVTGALDAVPNSTYENPFLSRRQLRFGRSGGGQTLFPSMFASVTTDAAGHASFTQTAQFLPAGPLLTALARVLDHRRDPRADDLGVFEEKGEKGVRFIY